MPSSISFFLSTTVAVFFCIEAATFIGGPACLENNPEICSTMSGTSPSPASICFDDAGENCTTTYVGGFSWTHSFFVSVTNTTEIGLDTTIYLEDDMVNCSVTVNNEECNSCTVCEASDTGDTDVFSADCTNINHDMEVGRKIECESAVTPFYPLALETTDSMSPGNTEVTDGDSDRETTSTPGSAAACIMGMASTAVFLMASVFFV